MCAVDVFTRRTWAEPMVSATPGEVKRVLEGIGENPRILDTDLGNEFKGELRQYLEDKSIAHRTKDPKDLNALAVCDRNIQQIKKAISSMQMETPDVAAGKRTWARGVLDGTGGKKAGKSCCQMW